MVVPPGWGRRHPHSLSLGTVSHPHPSQRPLFCSPSFKQEEKKKKKRRKKRAAHLCFSLCGLWFQPNKTIGHSKVSKTALASLTCSPCPSPVWWHCGTQGPQFSPLRWGTAKLVPIAPLLDRAQPPPPQLLTQTGAGSHATAKSRRHMGGRAAVEELGWKHLQSAGVKKAGKDPESIFLGEPRAFWPCLEAGVRPAGPLWTSPAFLMHLLWIEEERAGRTGLTPKASGKAKGFRELHTSPSRWSCRPRGAVWRSGSLLKAGTKPQWLLCHHLRAAEKPLRAAAAALARAEPPSRSGSGAWGWCHCHLHTSGRWSRSHRTSPEPHPRAPHLAEAERAAEPTRALHRRQKDGRSCWLVTPEVTLLGQVSGMTQKEQANHNPCIIQRPELLLCCFCLLGQPTAPPSSPAPRHKWLQMPIQAGRMLTFLSKLLHRLGMSRTDGSPDRGGPGAGRAAAGRLSDADDHSTCGERAGGSFRPAA